MTSIGSRLTSSSGLVLGAMLMACGGSATTGGSSGSSGQSPVAEGHGGGGAKRNGDACAMPSEASAECASGICRQQGKASYCTVRCERPSAAGDPTCTGGPPFSGSCSADGYCQIALD
jgi:hypothetical protein